MIGYIRKNKGALPTQNRPSLYPTMANDATKIVIHREEEKHKALTAEYKIATKSVKKHVKPTMVANVTTVFFIAFFLFCYLRIR